MSPFIGHQGSKGFHLQCLIFGTFEAYKTFGGGYRGGYRTKTFKIRKIVLAP